MRVGSERSQVDGVLGEAVGCVKNTACDVKGGEIAAVLRQLAPPGLHPTVAPGDSREIKRKNFSYL